MQFNTEQFLIDYGIPYISYHGTLTSKYLALETCPFCGAKATSTRTYGAVSKEYTATACWLCHTNDFYQFIQLSTGISDYGRIKEIYAKYGNSSSIYQGRSEKEIAVRPTTIDVPGHDRMLPNAEKFLIKRGFNPDYVWEKYSLRNTTHHSKVSYSIVFPVYFNGRIVSYTSRDYTDLKSVKAKACKRELEIIEHKDIFFGWDDVKSKNVVIVEGESDRMRVGSGSLASFGTEVTLPQIMLLAGNFDNVFILFDQGEESATEHAHEMAIVLNSIGTNCEVLEFDIDGDPDEIFRDDPSELVYLKKDLQIY